MAEMTHDTRRKVAEGSALGAGLLMALVLFAMVNYLSHRQYKRWDWTSSQIYSLSDKSLGVVQGIDRDIDAVIFFDNPGSDTYAQVDEMLSRYAAASPRINKRVIDPAKNLLEAQRLAERYEVDRANVVILATDDDRRVIDELDMAEYDYSGAQFGQAPTLKAFKGEQLITSALLELVESRKPKVLFTIGHGEGQLAPGTVRSLSAARDLLGKDNFEIEEWASLGKTEVPTDTDLLVIAGPTSNFLPPEVEVFSRYLDDGGRLLLLLDPTFAADGGMADLGLSDWLRDYGVEVSQDIVIDPSQQMPFFGPETLFTSDYGLHQMVESLEQTRTPVLLPLARSVRKSDTPPDSMTVTELLRTSDEAWAETNIAALPEVDQDDQDLAGPVSLAVAVSFPVDTGDIEASTDAASEDETEANETEVDNTEEGAEARLAVFGDFDFASDSQVQNAANATLLLNAFNWLVKREELLAIEAKTPEQTQLSLTGPELSTIYGLVLGLLPGLAIALGITVHLRRRR